MRQIRRHDARWKRVAGAVVALGILAASTGAAQAETIRSRQWYLDAMHAEEMWRNSTGVGVTVAVVDTGVDADLPDIRGQVLPGKDFSGMEGGAQSDYDGHGTDMAVIIAGTGKSNGGTGTFGLAPGAKILPVRFANAQAPARGFRAMSSVAMAIRFAADSEAKIINISQAGPSQSEVNAKAVEYALSKGKLVFAGVGNSGKEGNHVLYPAAYPGVVGVAAVDEAIRATDESERGPQVDLAAPGDNIVTACKGGTGLCRGHGTSAATALASASAALVWSAHPDWTANQVLRVLINTAGGPKSGEKRSDSLGYGVVRPRIALQNPGDPGPRTSAPSPNWPRRPRSRWRRLLPGHRPVVRRVPTTATCC
ncbi:type VII secretion-associated serine protease mycosin [Streptomyces griseocarneus]|uniref:type VII secretion-associated serine protease mycosin n=1 Tax=Streptomyces griseocarneus TaxID=51201 RepID=UPI001F6111C4|nr:type VII secretion-associated serine protease mycosin [Streptomyces griseocarneus]